jgi:hypothetical protein
MKLSKYKLRNKINYFEISLSLCLLPAQYVPVLFCGEESNRLLNTSIYCSRLSGNIIKKTKLGIIIKWIGES